MAARRDIMPAGCRSKVINNHNNEQTNIDSPLDFLEICVCAGESDGGLSMKIRRVEQHALVS